MTLPRLSNATLADLPAAVERPAYDRAAIETGIVHLGVGAFHRAHQAVYTDAVLKDDPRWGILGVSLRNPDTRDALEPQDGLYTVAAVDGAGARLKIVGSSTGLVVAPEDPARLVEILARPTTRIVTLTVTEKGYCHDPATGRLNESDPGIRHDLEHIDRPKTAIGFLAAGLKRRFEAGVAPFTVLSCDNLPANGETVKRILSRFAELVDPAFGRFVASEVAFPSSMVDRIVPATTEADHATIAAALGVADHWPVMTEPFSQWVIEDHFTLGRPDWASAGAEFVADVKPYELMKLRLLNGSHSTIAYLGYLMGRGTVSEAMAVPALKQLVTGLMDEEITPTLPTLSGLDVGRYKRSLVERFENPALKHRTWQIAMDGSQKLPQRLLGTIRDRISAGASFERLALGVAAWMRYVTGLDEDGAPIDVRDPLAARLKAIGEAGRGDARHMVAGYLEVREVFGADLAGHADFRATLERHLTKLLAQGARATVEGLA
jgi:fructuronate reductase